MGKAARRKRERHETPPVAPAHTRPRWAGADGFDHAWRLTEAYLASSVAAREADPAGGPAILRASAEVAQRRSDMLSHKVSTLESLIVSRGGAPTPSPPRGAVLPGDVPRPEDEFWAECRSYANGLHTLATGHLDALRTSTPILFDPLSTPAVEDHDLTGVRLPFPVVTCDFLTAQGISMPIRAATELKNSEWVGLVAATLVEQGEGIIDVWPVVKVLSANDPDHAQTGRSMMFGCVRFGGELDEPPVGIDRLQVGKASVWSIALDSSGDADRAEMWATLWVLLPAQAALSALRLLDAVNVDLAPADLSRPARRRAAREGADIALEVVIRTSRRDSPQSTGTIDWQHRWMVRGHWKHFSKGPVFNANPRKRVIDAKHGECVKVWCPPFVKGPDDAPLILKARRVDHRLDAHE
jgi:hypothetical protein